MGGVDPVGNTIPGHGPWNKFAAELFGTFCLVFAGTGAIVANDFSNGAVTHVGIALTFGLVVLALIYSLGEVSGCHLNPAVTLGFLVAGRFERRSVIPYLIAQFLGATLASLALLGMFLKTTALARLFPREVLSNPLPWNSS